MKGHKVWSEDFIILRMIDSKIQLWFLASFLFYESQYNDMKIRLINYLAVIVSFFLLFVFFFNI